MDKIDYTNKSEKELLIEIVVTINSFLNRCDQRCNEKDLICQEHSLKIEALEKEALIRSGQNGVLSWFINNGFGLFIAIIAVIIAYIKK